MNLYKYIPGYSLVIFCKYANLQEFALILKKNAKLEQKKLIASKSLYHDVLPNPNLPSMRPFCSPALPLPGGLRPVEASDRPWICPLGFWPLCKHGPTPCKIPFMDSLALHETEDWALPGLCLKSCFKSAVYVVTHAASASKHWLVFWGS